MGKLEFEKMLATNPGMAKQLVLRLSKAAAAGVTPIKLRGVGNKTFVIKATPLKKRCKA